MFGIKRTIICKYSEWDNERSHKGFNSAFQLRRGSARGSPTPSEAGTPKAPFDSNPGESHP